jgi:DNA-binding NtrC family response regulator
MAIYLEFEAAQVQTHFAAGAVYAGVRQRGLHCGDPGPIQLMGANMLDSSPILIISGECEHRAQLADSVSKVGLFPVCCATVADVRALVKTQPFCAAVSEDQLPDGDFREVICEMRRHSAHPPVVVVSRRDDWDFYLSTVRMGAFDSVAFPPTPGELERVLWTALSEVKRS